MPAPWPSVLWIVRHGESAAMLVSHAATSGGDHRIALNARDMDTGLSVAGAAQAHALGQWFAGQDDANRPEIILTSPYQRAHDTATALALNIPVIVDERLRERELGILDGLTWEGVKALHPDQAAQRDLLGKFYHRPPGGENWCDVIQRLRGVVDRITLHYAGRRVMIVAHECVIFCLRYILEELDEAGVLAIDAAGDIANCALTEYRHEDRHGLVLTRFNDTAPLQSLGAAVTRAREPIAAARG
jgi:ribonuclease H / adenosylcobalamin/alpha-ribazole phosphatase